MIFEWDINKETENVAKHAVDFETACRVFQDERRIVMDDVKHSDIEPRYSIIGLVDEKILTVRFTMRGTTVRIIGAGYWRKEKKHYEQKYNSGR